MESCGCTANDEIIKNLVIIQRQLNHLVPDYRAKRGREIFEMGIANQLMLINFFLSIIVFYRFFK